MKSVRSNKHTRREACVKVFRSAARYFRPVLTKTGLCQYNVSIQHSNSVEIPIAALGVSCMQIGGVNLIGTTHGSA
jgi:hypothetical protein